MGASSKVLPNAERCRAFWAREAVDRPLLATWVGSYVMSSLFPRGLARLPEGQLAPADIQFENFREDYEDLFEKHLRAPGDVPWSAFPLMVLPWMEAVAGCPIVHSAGNVWAEPWLDSIDRAQDPAILQPRLDWLARLAEFTEWLVELSGGRFPVAVCLMRGPADVLAAMRGAQDSVLDVMDNPRAVQRLLDWITELWIETARAQLSRIPSFAGGHGWSVQNLWSEKPGAWFQDDAIAYWSPSLYRKYAVPAEARLASAVEVTGCHLHSAAIFTVDELLRMPDLGVIEMNLDVVGMTIPEMIPAFQRILETQRLYVWGTFTEADLRTMREALPARGLALQLMAETPEQVRELVELVDELWAR